MKVPGDLKAYVDWLTIDMSFNTYGDLYYTNYANIA